MAPELPLTGILVEKPRGHRHALETAVRDRIGDRNLPVAVAHGLLVQPTAPQVMRHIHDGVRGEWSPLEIQCKGRDIVAAGIHGRDCCPHAARKPDPEHGMAVCDPHARTLGKSGSSDPVRRTGLQDCRDFATGAARRLCRRPL